MIISNKEWVEVKWIGRANPSQILSEPIKVARKIILLTKGS